MQRIFEEISEVMDKQAADRAAKEATKSTNPPARTSTPTEGPEQESSTTKCEEDGNNDFDSEEDAALLKCAESDNEAESLLEKIGGDTKSVFMSSKMISYIINFPLADKMAKLSLSVKKIFTIEEENPPTINWGDWIFRTLGCKRKNKNAREAY